MQECNGNMEPIGLLREFADTDDLSEQLSKVIRKGNNAIIHQKGFPPVIVRPLKQKYNAFYRSRKSRAY